MPCSHYSSVRSWKKHAADEPYCRNADWWKNPDWQLRKEDSRSQYVDQSPSYTIRKPGKNWSLVVLSHGLQGLTDAEKKFRHYAAKWKDEIGGDSSLTRITNNMNYLRIICIGDEAIPLILQELQREPAPWFVALRAISGDDSVGRDSPGNFRKMAAAWLKWGKDHGYI